MHVRRTMPFLLSVLMVSAAMAAGPKQMSVQVNKAEVRSSPSPFAEIIATVNYGDRLMVLGERGAWSQVNLPAGGLGWIHTSLITTKKVKLQAGEKDAELAASSGELALAGKGFNAQVEAEFKTKNKDVDFSWVDKMGKTQVTEKEVQTFLKAGDVTPPEGGKP